MKYLFSFLSLSWLFCLQPLAASGGQLSLDDVPQVMERFFHFHIENNEWNPTLVRRSLKLYIEQFDSDKSYFLEEEVAPYLAMSEARVEEIQKRLEKNNYSDFFEVNRLAQKEILRARNLRTEMGRELSAQKRVTLQQSQGVVNRYAKTLSEISDKQKQRMVRFYKFHEERSRLDTEERKAKVFVLFEKKIGRFENSYLFLDSEGAKLSQERTEHLLSLRILKAFAKSLDTHTAFFSPEEALEMRLSLEKQFEGVGVVLSEGIDGIVIADLIHGGPAEQSGKIQINDQLVEIDGKGITHVSFEEIMELLKKKDRSEIILGLRRIDPVMEKESFFRVSLTKKPIAVKEDRIRSSYELVDGGVVGKITLQSFYENSDGVSSERDIREAIRSFRQAGELKGLVLDLRENSGGFLGQAVRVAGLFLGNGVVVISKYGKGDVHYLRNISGKRFFGGPLVVLTSKMSASASEIVAQALQDYGVALIVGDDRTFGKGSIQYQTITDEQANLFFKVTVGRYYTVSGRSAQIEGVKADILVPSHYAPYRIGERYLEYALPADQVAPAYIDPLTDLDEKSRAVFRKRYLPTLQKVVSFWQKSLPALKAASAKRMSANPQFQVFLQKIEQIRLDRKS